METGKSMRNIASTMGHTEGYTRKKKYKSKETLLAMIQQDHMYEEFVRCELVRGEGAAL